MSQKSGGVANLPLFYIFKTNKTNRLTSHKQLGIIKKKQKQRVARDCP